MLLTQSLTSVGLLVFIYSFTVNLTTLSGCHIIASIGGMIAEERTGKDLEGIGRGLI
jgi:hypothetical protein